MTDAVHKAGEAKRILADPVFAEAIEMGLDACYREWLACTEGTHAREAIWHRARNIGEVKKALRTLANVGVRERKTRETVNV